MMLMVRREALSRYKHLLESDTAQQTELAGTKPPLGTGVDDMPKGVKALEAALNEERMAQAVEMFEKSVQYIDGRWRFRFLCQKTAMHRGGKARLFAHKLLHDALTFSSVYEQCHTTIVTHAHRRR